MGYRYTTQYMTDNADIMFDDVRSDSIVIAPFWDDLKIFADSSIVIAQNTQYYVIQYKNMGFGYNETLEEDKASFKVIIPKSTSNANPLTIKNDFLGRALPRNKGVVYFHYQDLKGEGLGGKASIGIQNASVKQKHVFSYDRATLADDTLITCCFGMNTSPAKEDSDFDGLNDFEEFTIGTNPFQPDTDGDGLSDGWEWEFRDDGFNPLINNDGDLKKDKDADFEGDGLTNQEEANWGTDPNNADSDGDGTPDKDEIEQSSDPDDPDDGGLPASRMPVSINFGDHSGSHSEKYEVELKPVGRTGKSFRWVNAEFGECETKTAMLVKDAKYTLTLTHSATNRSDVPDLDYTIEIHNLGTGLIVKDPDTLLGVYSDPTPFKSKVVTIHVFDLMMSADYNRDGEIDDADYGQALRGKPLRWWTNWDRDWDIQNGVNGGYDRHSDFFDDRNNKDLNVNGRCDLEDWAPIKIKIGSAVKALLQENNDYYLVLAQEHVALNCVWYYGNTTNVIDDFYEAKTSKRFGKLGDKHAWEADVDTIYNDGIFSGGTHFPEALMTHIKTSDSGEILLFVEGNIPATLPLQLQLRRSKFGPDEDIAEVKLSLHITQIDKMFSTLNVRSRTPDFTKATSPACPTATQTLFFLHGYSVDELDSDAWFATMFKRFHISGANINFCGVTWHGDDQWSALPDYYHNVENAFTAAEKLDTFLRGLSANNQKALPTPHSFMAHSLGNMVVSSMIQDHNTPIKSYFMMNAAVPSEAYSDSDATPLAMRLTAPSGLIHDDWKALTQENGTTIPAYPPKAWSANFAALFVSTAENPVEDTPLNRAKRSLTWYGRFKDVTSTAGLSVFNYYSKGTNEESGDEVFELMDTTPDWDDGMGDGNKGRYSWQKQESYKGRLFSFSSILPIEVVASYKMGWGIHNKKRSTSAAAIAMSIPQLRTKPFFIHKPEIILSENENDAWTISGQRNRLLAYGIPAISEAAGRVKLPQIIETSNVDLQATSVSFARDSGRFTNRWLHSDIKDVAYSFNAEMFKKIISKNQGDLK